MLFDHPLHPMVVHFPVALLLTGLAMELVGLVWKKPWLGQSALVLLVAGTVGLFAALRTGEAEEDRIVQTPAIRETIEIHEDSGKLTFWIFVALSLARGALAWKRPRRSLAAWAIVLVWILGAASVVRTAHYGGELVFTHGAGLSAARGATGEAPEED